MLFQGRKLIVVALTKSGSMEYALTMCKKFQSLNPILFFSSSSDYQFPKKANLVKSYSDSIFSFIWNSILFFLKVDSILKKLKLDNDKLSLYLPVFHPWNLMWINSAKKRNVPSIVTVHDFNTHSGEKSTIVEFIQRRCIRRADKIIFLSDFAAQQAREAMQIDPGKIIILPHPLLDMGAINNLTFSTKPKFLLLGRVLAYKGLDLFVEALQKRDQLNLTIAGRGASRFSNRPNIQCIEGHLSKEKIGHLLSSHEVLVLPYTEASQSGIFSMGVQAEMFIMLTKVGGLTEQLDDEAGFWVKAQLEDFLVKIDLILEDRSVYTSIKTEVAAYKIRYQLNWEASFKKLLESSI